MEKKIKSKAILNYPLYELLVGDLKDIRYYLKRYKLKCLGINPDDPITPEQEEMISNKINVEFDETYNEIRKIMDSRL